MCHYKREQNKTKKILKKRSKPLIAVLEEVGIIFESQQRGSSV